MVVKTFSCDCPFCNLQYGIAVTLTDEQAERIKNRDLTGETIQSIIPNEKPWIRECLISGICPTCQDKVFNSCDDDEDEWDDDEEEWDDECDEEEEDNDGEVLIELDGVDASVSDEEAIRILASLGIII